MKLLIGSSAQPDRGAGVHSYVQELCLLLRKRGHDVTLISQPAADASWKPEPDVRHYGWAFGSDPLQVARNIHGLLAQEHFDGVINNDHPILQSLASASRAPFISVGHLGRTSMATLACHGSEWVDYVVAISSDMRATFVRDRKVPAEKVRVVFNGVADQGAVPATVRRGPLQLLYGGGYLRYKGADKLLEAATAGAWGDARLHWYGDLPSRIERRLHSLPHVTMHGRVPRDRFTAALLDADCVVLPSREEGCPMVLLEAMSRGIVPIVSDGIGAMKEIVRSGHNGFVCRLSRWPEDLGEALHLLASDRRRLTEMKAAARESYLAGYTSDHTVDGLLALLAAPLVDRTRLPRTVPILDWHRPVPNGGLQLLRKIRTRFGWLRRAHVLDVHAPAAPVVEMNA